MQVGRKLASMLVGLALAACVSLFSAASASAAVLGGVDLDGYCKSIGYWGVVLESHDAYGWRCQRATERAHISMTAACRWQYGNPAARDVLPALGPYDWKCVV